jgi:hypothetical protein
MAGHLLPRAASIIDVVGRFGKPSEPSNDKPFFLADRPSSVAA